MNTDQIIVWLTYWRNAKMVDVDKILAFDQVATARRYCECMRIGVFHPYLVSDLAIWHALTKMRSGIKRRDGSHVHTWEQTKNALIDKCKCGEERA